MNGATKQAKHHNDGEKSQKTGVLPQILSWFDNCLVPS